MAFSPFLNLYVESLAANDGRPTTND